MFSAETLIPKTSRGQARAVWPTVGLLCLVAVMAGCIDEFYAPGDGMRLLGHAALEGEACQPGPTGATPLIMDVGLTGEYVFFARVENNTPDILLVESARYSVNVPREASFAGPVGVTTIVSGAVPVGGSAVIPVVVVESVLGSVLMQAPEFRVEGNVVDVELDVSLSATTPSGVLVESQTLKVPLTICSYCLIEHDFDVLITGRDGEPSCDMTQAVGDQELPALEPPCLIGQDAPVDCRLCYTRFDDPTIAALVCDP